MAGRNLGDAFVVIYPEAGNFLTELTAKVNAAIGAYKAPAVTVPVNADTGPALTAMTALIAKSKTLFESLGHLKADVQTAQGTAALSKMQAQVLALAKQMGALVLKADTAKFDAQIAAKIAQLRTLERQLSGLKMDADDKAFVAKLAALRKQAADLEKAVGSMTAQLDIEAAETKLAALKAEIRELEGSSRAIEFDAKNDAILQKIFQVEREIGVLRQEAASVQFDATDLADFASKLDAVTAQAEKFNKIFSEPIQGPVTQELTLLVALSEKLSDTLTGMRADIHDTGARAVLDGLELRSEKLKSVLADLGVGGVTGLAVRMAEARAEASKMVDAVAKLDASLAAPVPVAATAELAGLRKQADDLIAELADFKIHGDDAGLKAQLAALQLQATRFAATLRDAKIGLDPGRMAVAVATLDALNARTAAFTRQADAAGTKTGFWATMVQRFAAANQTIGWTTMLGGIAGWHILLDLVIEATIIATGVTLALGAAFAVLYPVVDQLSYRMKATFDVMTAFGSDAGPLAKTTQQMDTLRKQLAPQVFEFFGGVINLMGNHFTEVADAARGVLNLFDTWIAKIDIWVGSQKSLNGMFQAGVGYLAQLGKAVGIFAQAIDNMLRKDPGIAHYLLDLIQGFAMVLNLFSRLPGPVVSATLLLHGLYLWASILGGIFMKMTQPIVMAATWIANLGAKSREAAAANLAEAATADTAAVEKLGATAAEAAMGLGGLAAAEKAVAEGAAADAATQAGDALATEADAAAGAGKELGGLSRILPALAGGLTVAWGALKNFLTGLLAIITSPVTWFVLATAAIVAMGIEARRATPDVAKLIDTLNQKINSDQASAAMRDIASAVGTAHAKIAEINSGGALRTFNENWHSAGGTWQNISAEMTATGGAFGKAIGDMAGTLTGRGSFLGTLKDWGHAFHDFFGHPGAPAEAARNVKLLDDQISKWLGDQRTLFQETGNLMSGTTGISGLNKQTLTYTQSLTLMDMAGVKAGDSLALMNQKIANLVAGYAEMSAGGPQLAASINAVTFQTELQDSKVSELNSGWDTFFKMISGGTSDFLTFAQQVNGMNETFSGSANAAQTLTVSNGKVHDSFRAAASAASQGTASMTGLNDASIAAQQTLLQTASAANQQMDSLQTLAAAAGMGGKGLDLLQQASKDMVQQMLPAAQGSQQLTTDLYALAQRGGYKGADSFRDLSNWAGKTKNPMLDLQGIVTTFTVKAGNLTQDVQNLSVALGQNLTQAMSQAIVLASGGQTAFDNFATAVLSGHADGKLLYNTALALGDSLLKATGNVSDAKTQFLAFAQGALHMSSDEANSLWNEIAGHLNPAIDSVATLVQGQAKKAFEDWANNGLHLGKDKADELWTLLTSKLGPELEDLATNHGPKAKKAFEDWAGKGGASGLGLTIKQADALWSELQTLQGQIDSMHGTNLNIDMTGNGSYTLRGPYVPAVSTQFGANAPSKHGGAAGGRHITGGSGPTADDVPIWVSRGEYVMNAASVSKYGLGMMNAVNAGRFAGGGLALGGPGGMLGMSPSVHDLAGPPYGYGMTRGYASGGSVGPSIPGRPTPGFPPPRQPNWPPYSGNLTADNIQGMYHDFQQFMIQGLTTQMAAALHQAETSYGGPTASAVLRYAESFAGTPYVWGGDTPSGWDCSGFVSYVLEKFGFLANRMVASGLQAWAKPSAAFPGAMAFYGAPAHHVGFVADANTLFSALGRNYGTTYSSLNLGDNSGYGIPPSMTATTGGSAAAGGAGGSIGYWQSVGREMAGQYGWTGSEFDALNLLWMKECVPLYVRILTRRGWLTCDEVQVGDETIGYNFETGASEWTRITAVRQYGPVPVARFGNKYWSTECTWNHRWLAEQMGRHVRYGPRPEREVLEWREVIKDESLTELRHLRKTQRVVLARPADLGPGTLPVSVREAALLGWIAGDGWVNGSREYWRDRKPDLLPSAEAPFGYRRDGQPKKNRSGAPRKNGKRRKVNSLTISIQQSKPEYFAAIDTACSADPDCARGTREPRKENWRIPHVWRLSAAYSRDLLARAGNPKTDAVAQVLAMSGPQRDAWLDAITGAEGTRSGNRTVLYQDDGPVADAIELAIYLSGRCPSRTKDTRGEGKGWAIRSVSPYIGGQQRNRLIEDAGAKPVWCPTTELGSWTAQDGGRVFLTGNSGWNPAARNPSSGAAGIPQDISGNMHGGGVGQIAWGLAYIASRYGDPIRAWAHEISSNWYKHGGPVGLSSGGLVGLFDQGGVLPPGLSIAYNGTGADETVIPVPPEALLGYATGGVVTAYRGQLTTRQNAERKDYAEFLAAAKAALAHPKAGSYEATHHKSILNEMGTLAKRQRSEDEAYMALRGAGLTIKDLSHLASMAHSEITTTHDIALSKLPGRTLGMLRSVLAALAWLAVNPPSLLSTLGPGAETLYPAWPVPMGQVSLQQFWTWLPRLQHDEEGQYKATANAFRASMAKDKPGGWAFTHRATTLKELQTLALRQNEEISAYNTLMKYNQNQPPRGALSHISAMAKGIGTTVQDVDLNHIPGGHPALLAGIYRLAGQIYDLAGKQVGVPETPFPALFGTPALPKRGTQAYATLASIFGWYGGGGIISFDRGGILPPGLTLAVNATGRSEIVSPAPPGTVYGPGGATHGELQIINRLDRLIQIMGAAPAAYSQALNGVAGQAANRGFYGSVR